MIIFISGKAQSGKDFTAELFQYNLDLNSKSISFETYKKYIIDDPMFGAKIKPTFQIKRFADKLKEICSIILNIPRYKYENLDFKQSLIKNYNITYREFLNKTADMMCSINKNIWVESLFQTLYENNNYIIPDLRFKHELYEAKKIPNSIFIRIKSNKYLVHHHQSELDLDDVPDSEFDFIIENSEKDFNLLNNQILDIIKKIQYEKI